MSNQLDGVLLRKIVQSLRSIVLKMTELGMPSNPEMVQVVMDKVRIYTADGVTSELEKSKLDYLQASIAVTANRRVMIPHFLFSKMHDFATDLDSLAEWIIKQLPTSWPLRKSMLECFKGHTGGKISHMVDVIPNDSEFQYLLRV
ncbi:hypothetical protein BHM03_00001591 [Ensete ventricosum]|nr:hypothetical protein BHM03_00001591 [Ensete ventricosum]